MGVEPGRSRALVEVLNREDVRALMRRRFQERLVGGLIERLRCDRGVDAVFEGGSRAVRGGERSHASALGSQHIPNNVRALRVEPLEFVT
jgi:hypothetical protein